MRTYRKDTNEVINLGFDWSGALAGDTISSSTWTIPAGLTGANGEYEDTTADITVSGGTVNTQYRCINKITTADGYTYERSAMVLVADR